jgi:hypothetical protein
MVTGLVLLSVPRDSVMEMLFEQDNEEKSIASLILDTLVKVHQTTHRFSILRKAGKKT